MNKNGLKYAFSVIENEIIYSIDMIRIRVEIMDKKLDNLFRVYLKDDEYKNVVYKENRKELSFRHFATCQYKNDKVLKMMYYLNGVSNDKRHMGYIEFNPNSFAGLNEFWDDFEILKSYFPYKEIVRFDIAIDIPIIRNKVAMLKDNRIYTSYRKSALDFTETLGKRNNVGRVKLYNKTIESSLDYDLTRLEVTADLHNINLPKVYDLRNIKYSEDDLIKAILKNDQITLALADLSLYKRSKIIKFLRENEIKFCDECINKAIEFVEKVVN